jgi:LysM repeat protein
VRFFNPRAQELGRRVAPLLAQRPEQNIALHRVRKGDTLGALARHYGSSVKAIQKANHMTRTALRLSQVLKIPLHGPCTHCPVPPPLLIPPRHLSPTDHVTQPVDVKEVKEKSTPEAPTPDAGQTHSPSPGG